MIPEASPEWFVPTRRSDPVYLGSISDRERKKILGPQFLREVWSFIDSIGGVPIRHPNCRCLPLYRRPKSRLSQQSVGKP